MDECYVGRGEGVAEDWVNVAMDYGGVVGVKKLDCGSTDAVGASCEVCLVSLEGDC